MHISIEQHGTVRVLRWDRPEKRNAITASMYTHMAELLTVAGNDDGVRAVVLMGTEKAFSAGNDVEDFLRHPPLGANAPVLHFLATISTFAKPLLAAVRGAAAGVGSTMLLHCDLVFASDDARFSFPFTQLGLCPEAGSSLLLPRLVGHQRAAELLLLGEPFNAQEAHRIGMVNRVVASVEVESMALNQAQKLALLPASAVVATKALLKGNAGDSVAMRIENESAQFGRLLQQAAAQEAFKAFAEKRAPRFQDID